MKVLISDREIFPKNEQENLNNELAYSKLYRMGLWSSEELSLDSDNKLNRKNGGTYSFLYEYRTYGDLFIKGRKAKFIQVEDAYKYVSFKSLVNILKSILFTELQRNMLMRLHNKVINNNLDADAIPEKDKVTVSNVKKKIKKLNKDEYGLFSTYLIANKNIVLCTDKPRYRADTAHKKEIEALLRKLGILGLVAYDKDKTAYKYAVLRVHKNSIAIQKLQDRGVINKEYAWLEQHKDEIYGYNGNSVIDLFGRKHKIREITDEERDSFNQKMKSIHKVTSRLKLATNNDISFDVSHSGVIKSMDFINFNGSDDTIIIPESEYITAIGSYILTRYTSTLKLVIGDNIKHISSKFCYDYLYDLVIEYNGNNASVIKDLGKIAQKMSSRGSCKLIIRHISDIKSVPYLPSNRKITVELDEQVFSDLGNVTEEDLISLFELNRQAKLKAESDCNFGYYRRPSQVGSSIYGLSSYSVGPDNELVDFDYLDTQAIEAKKEWFKLLLDRLGQAENTSFDANIHTLYAEAISKLDIAYNHMKETISPLMDIENSDINYLVTNNHKMTVKSRQLVGGGFRVDADFLIDFDDKYNVFIGRASTKCSSYYEIKDIDIFKDVTPAEDADDVLSRVLALAMWEERDSSVRAKINGRVVLLGASVWRYPFGSRDEYLDDLYAEYERVAQNENLPYYEL